MLRVLVSKLILNTDTKRNNCPTFLQLFLLESLTQQTRTLQETQPLVVDHTQVLFPQQYAGCLVYSRASINAHPEISCSSRCFLQLRCSTSGDNKCPLTWLRAPARPTPLRMVMWWQVERNNRLLVMKTRIIPTSLF